MSMKASIDALARPQVLLSASGWRFFHITSFLHDSRHKVHIHYIGSWISNAKGFRFFGVCRQATNTFREESSWTGKRSTLGADVRVDRGPLGCCIQKMPILAFSIGASINVHFSGQSIHIVRVTTSESTGDNFRPHSCIRARRNVRKRP